MIVEFWILFFLIGFFFFFLSIKYKEMFFLGLLSGLIFFFLGMTLFVEGLEYQNGISENFSINQTSVVNSSSFVFTGSSESALVRSNINNTVFIDIIKYALSLGGLVSIIYFSFAWINFKKSSKKRLFTGDDGDD